MSMFVTNFTLTSPSRNDLYDLFIGTHPDTYLTLGEDLQQNDVLRDKEVPDKFKIFEIVPKSNTEVNQVFGSEPYVKLNIKRYNQGTGTFEDTKAVFVQERSILEIPGLFRMVTVKQAE